MISKIQKTLLNIKKNIPMGGLWAFSVHAILFRTENPVDESQEQAFQGIFLSHEKLRSLYVENPL